MSCAGPGGLPRGVCDRLPWLGHDVEAVRVEPSHTALMKSEVTPEYGQDGSCRGPNTLK